MSPTSYWTVPQELSAVWETIYPQLMLENKQKSGVNSEFEVISQLI
jgi:hypothetical protein